MNLLELAAGDLALLGAFATLFVISFLNSVWPLIESLRDQERSFREALPDAIEKLMVPLSLMAIIFLCIANHKAIKDSNNAIVGELAKHSDNIEVFDDTAAFFEDLKAESLSRSVRSSYVTLIRHAPNEEFSNSAAVDAYYDSILERCRSDESFTLRRVFGVTNERMLEEAKEHADEARNLPNYEYRVFSWSQDHNPINLVVLEDDRGPHVVYIIVPPSGKALLKTIKISNAREIALLMKKYHTTLFLNAVEPTTENLRLIEEAL